MPYNPNFTPDAPLPISMLPDAEPLTDNDLLLVTQPSNAQGRSRKIPLGNFLDSPRVQRLSGTKSIYSAYQDSATWVVDVASVLGEQASYIKNVIITLDCANKEQKLAIIKVPDGYTGSITIHPIRCPENSFADASVRRGSATIYQTKLTQSPIYVYLADGSVVGSESYIDSSAMSYKTKSGIIYNADSILGTDLLSLQGIESVDAYVGASYSIADNLGGPQLRFSLQLVRVGSDTPVASVVTRAPVASTGYISMRLSAKVATLGSYTLSLTAMDFDPAGSALPLNIGSLLGSYTITY